MLLLAVTAAVACPTLAAGTPSELSYDVAQVAIVRVGTRTTFSVSVNPTGDPQDFALVLPVPEVLSEEDVRTLPDGVFAGLDISSAPLHVSDAGCYSYSYGSSCNQSWAATSPSSSGSTSLGVGVVGSWLEGDYLITVLTAEESAGLLEWLNTNGYQMPAAAESLLAEYIEAGQYFMAAKVAEGAQLADGTSLPPLQVVYHSEVFSIPIRLATANSPGEQDLIIYAVTTAEAGAVGISNYPEFTVPDRCVWQGSDFSEFYEAQFTEAWERMASAAWTVEYEAGADGANPSPGWIRTPPMLRELGFRLDYREHYLTRIHVRYTPEQAHSELALYETNLGEPRVLSYADNLEPNYDCVTTFCSGELTPQDPPPPEVECDDSRRNKAGSCGCGSGAPATVTVMLLGAALAACRRRRVG